MTWAEAFFWSVVTVCGTGLSLFLVILLASAAVIIYVEWDTRRMIKPKKDGDSR